jgi:hypothetical protein
MGLGCVKMVAFQFFESGCIAGQPSSTPTSGSERPCRDAGVGAIAPGFAMLERAKRASHIDPPASSYAIMRRARSYRGENPEPGKDVHGELDPTPGIREQPRSSTSFRAQAGHFCFASNSRRNAVSQRTTFRAISRLMRCNIAANPMLHAFFDFRELKERPPRDDLSETYSAHVFAGFRKGDQAARLNASCTA